MPTSSPHHVRRQPWRALSRGGDPAVGGSRWRVAVAGVLALVALAGVTAGCGGDDEVTVTDQRVTDAEADVEAGGDAGVCVPPECGTTVPFIPTEGFIGPEPDPTLDTAAAVDGGSVVTAERGEWWAQGLVVNGGAVLGGSPVVRAGLRDAAGEEFAVVEAPLPVVPLRPGEPSPFRVEAPGVDTARVADVTWRVVGGVEGADASVGRNLQLSVAWNRPAGGGPISVPGYSDGGGSGTPLVTYVSVRNTGTTPVVAPRVVAAWVDGRGRVLGLATADVLAPGTAEPLAVLEPGASADAVVVLAPPAATGLAAVPPLLWGVGR